jgi:putative FmdB family regulatory protein
MPIYEYRCTRCGEVTEVLQRVNEAPKRKCRSCSGKLEKLISRTSFQLKGGGWYNEGYSSGGTGAAKKKETGDKSKTTSGDTSSSKPVKKASSA